MSDHDAGLVWEILHRYTDPATARFDEALAAAGVDAATARVLRFWQRESVSGVKHYAAHAVPGVLAVLAAADADARSAYQRSEAALPRLAAPTVLLRLPEPGDAPLEERRRTVAQRLAQSG